MICAVIKGPSFLEISQQLKDSLPHADLVELRLDLFEKINKKELKLLRDQFSIPMIFTLRSVHQGGAFQGSETDYLKTISSLLDLHPEFLDLESHLPIQSFKDIQALHPLIQLICSYHDFTSTPNDLETIYDSLKKKPACYYKIAVMAKNSLDVLKLMIWAKNQDRKLIAVSMGPFGQVSRILAPIIGCPFTFASVYEEKENPLGQLSAQTLVDVYHFKSLNRHTKIYGLIGGTVNQSLSHETHNTLIKTMNLDAVYIKIIVQPEEVPSFLSLAKQLPFSGLSVTMPLKQVVMGSIEEIDPEAAVIGSVNTLLFTAEGIKGFNTDGIGALEAIESCFLVKNKKIVMIGAGGATKAIAYEACKRGAKVIILNRDAEKACRLADSLKCTGEGLDRMQTHFMEGYDLLINCTPSSLPIDPHFILFSAAVMDIKTLPKSLFLQEAKRKGCPLIYGYQMFVEQGIRQFDRWLNGNIEISKSREILNEKILTLLEYDLELLKK